MTTHIDPAKLASLRELDRPGNEGFFARIVGVFLNDARKRLQEMEAAVGSSDTASLTMSAHALKGGCAYLGADRLAELCLSLESKGQQGTLDGAPAILEEIHREVAEVTALLSAEVSR